MAEQFPKRKHPRLKSDVYDRAGMYFITICTKDRSPCLGKIVWEPERLQETARCVLSEAGMAVVEHLRRIPLSDAGAAADTFVVMPDHVHLLLLLEPGKPSGMVQGAWSPSTYTRMVHIVRSFKTMVTKQLGYSIWQTSFYEEILRNPSALASVRQYILANPGRWALRYGGIPEYVP
ncbi:MAG: transposase [Clostridia bacterium]|nr:transposase [Clostridia bacterium]